MIEIDGMKKEILFIPDMYDKEHPPKRSFKLLSGYVCPFCKKILAAYFQGQMSDADISYYEDQTPRYKIGSVSGGHYIKPVGHQGYSSDKGYCDWEEFTGRGVVENVRVFVERHDLARKVVQPLAEKLNTISGFYLVEDVCGRDKEMLLFCEDKLFGELRRKDYDAYYKAREDMGKFLMETIK